LPRAIEHEVHEEHEGRIDRKPLVKELLSQRSFQQSSSKDFFVFFVSFVFNRSWQALCDKLSRQELVAFAGDKRF
jgi:hypothetical protein